MQCTSGANSYDVTTMVLAAHQTVRVAISWLNNTAYPLYSTRPTANLDLFVRKTNNTIVASSVSKDGTAEVVQFTTGASSGTYKLTVNRTSCEFDTSLTVGWAWLAR